jgi:hypothetical protein
MAMWPLCLGGCLPDGKSLTVKTDPPQCEVLVDHRPVGVSPVKVFLPSGRSELPSLHVVEACKPGYLPEFAYVSGGGGALEFGSTITITLTELPDGAEDVVGFDLPPAAEAALASRLAAELRLVRVSDGTVLAQACAMGHSDDMFTLAHRLCRALETEMPDGLRPRGVALGRLRNRRNSDAGHRFARDLTRDLHTELRLCDAVDLTGEPVDLQAIFPEEVLDLPEIAQDPRIAELADDRPAWARKRHPRRPLQYILLGGVAESQTP